jgi:hypothetical protein
MKRGNEGGDKGIFLAFPLYPSTTSNLPSTPLFTFDHSFTHIQEIINLELLSSLSSLFWDFSNHNLNFMFHLINGVEEKG